MVVQQWPAPYELLKQEITNTRISELITIFKQHLLDLAQLLQLKMQLFLILSVLLVGSCLTVARVGIIMISLDHFDIYLVDMEHMLIHLAWKHYPTHFPTILMDHTAGEPYL